MKKVTKRSVKVKGKGSTQSTRAKGPSGQGLYGNVKGQSGPQTGKDSRRA